MNNDEDYLLMSGIQHFDFCRRQWAIIHIEQQWNENSLTAEGRIVHTRCHDDSLTEKRNDFIIMRGMRVVSHILKMVGICDVVEFYKSEDGISLNRYEGKWIPVPVEYKHGKSKIIDADRFQLCAQALALEEMFVCKINYGFLYYKQTNKREEVEFTEDLREKTKAISKEMNHYYEQGWTPSAKYKTKCKSCSLLDVCIPQLGNKKSVSEYIEGYIED